MTHAGRALITGWIAATVTALALALTTDFSFLNAIPIIVIGFCATLVTLLRTPR